MHSFLTGASRPALTAIGAVAVFASAALLAGQQPAGEGRVNGPDGVWWGLDNTPMIPGLPWRIHDANRPQPRVVKPPSRPGGPPGDAIVLFDGTDLSRWNSRNQAGERSPANWPTANGVMTAGPGMLTTRDSYGDVQLHIEFAMPTQVTGSSQSRGNSGLMFMGRYELQILDSYNNRTYADGMNAAIYGEWPPTINISTPPGEWQTSRLLHGALERRSRPQSAGGRRADGATDCAPVRAPRSGASAVDTRTRTGAVPEHLDPTGQRLRQTVGHSEPIPRGCSSDA